LHHPRGKSIVELLKNRSIMKNRWIKTTGLMVLTVIMLTGVNAQPREGRGLGPCGQGNPDFEPGYGRFEPGHGRTQPFACLDLTEEQQEQMQALRLEHYKTMKPLRNEMGELKARERTLLSADEPDMKAVYKVIDDQTGLRNKMRKLQVEHRVSVKKLLTEEQIMILDQRRGHAGKWKSGRKDFSRPCHQGRPYHRNMGW
jgi:Spy/CpxP family protein refolding chaperone